jgi:hypothetical protein
MRRSLDRDYYKDIQDLPPRPFKMSHRMHLGEQNDFSIIFLKDIAQLSKV